MKRAEFFEERIEGVAEAMTHEADEIDLSTTKTASTVTVGPADKSFDESLGITSTELERLMKSLLAAAKEWDS